MSYKSWVRLPTWAKRIFSGTEVDEDEDEPDVGFPWPPYIGTQAGPDWPEPPEDPENTIDVRLYWRAGTENGLRMCKQVKPYVEYCLLEAWGDRYDVNVTIQEDPVPVDIDSPSAFSTYYWSQDVMAKDCNILLGQLGSVIGSAGGYGGWIDAPRFLSGWAKDPESPIKNVGGGNNSPAEGIAIILHEIGHCLGLGHGKTTASVRAWGKAWVPPMSAGYENSEATRYAFEYHPDMKDAKPKLQPLGELDDTLL